MESLQKLLADCKLEAVAHRNADMLRTVSETTTVKDAMTMLKQRNILSVPVTSSDSQFSGVFSVTDVLKALVKALGLEKASKGRTSFDMKADDTALVLNRIYGSPVSSVMHPGDLWYVEGQNASVLDAVQDMLKRRQVHHRLFTCESLKDTSPSGILSQSDIVRLLWEHKVEFGEQLNATVESLGLCAAAAETVPATETTLQVLVDMWRDHKTCMGITDPKSKDLIGNVSISDLRSLGSDQFGMLAAPIGAFVLAIRGFPVPQGDATDWSATLRAIPVHIVTPSTRFEAVLHALSEHKLHRVYVLDHAEHSVGIITLTDVLRQLLPRTGEAPTEGPAAGLPHSSEVPGGATELEAHALKEEEAAAAGETVVPLMVAP